MKDVDGRDKPGHDGEMFEPQTTCFSTVRALCRD
jgi:hypothetical protein